MPPGGAPAPTIDSEFARLVPTTDRPADGDAEVLLGRREEVEQCVDAAAELPMRCGRESGAARPFAQAAEEAREELLRDEGFAEAPRVLTGFRVLNIRGLGVIL